MIIVLIVASIAGWPADLSSHLVPGGPPEVDDAPDSDTLVGASLASWTMRGIVETQGLEHLKWASAVSLRGISRAAAHYFGFITYEGSGVALAAPCPDEDGISDAWANLELAIRPRLSLGDWIRAQGNLHVMKIKILPALAFAAVSPDTCCFFALPITNRVRRPEGVHMPSTRRLKGWLKTTGAHGVPARTRGAATAARAGWGGFSARVIMEWVRATKTLKDLNSADEAAKAWAVALTSSRHEGRELYDASEKINIEIVRRARPRLDVLSCLLFRAFFATLTSCAVYLHCDGSPQWRGSEFFAASMDIVSSGWRQRRLLPCVVLSRLGLDAVPCSG